MGQRLILYCLACNSLYPTGEVFHWRQTILQYFIRYAESVYGLWTLYFGQSGPQIMRIITDFLTANDTN